MTEIASLDLIQAGVLVSLCSARAPGHISLCACLLNGWICTSMSAPSECMVCLCAALPRSHACTGCLLANSPPSRPFSRSRRARARRHSHSICRGLASEMTGKLTLLPKQISRYYGFHYKQKPPNRTSRPRELARSPHCHFSQLTVGVATCNLQFAPAHRGPLLPPLSQRAE